MANEVHGGLRRRSRARGAWYSPVAIIRGLILRPRLYLSVAAAVAAFHVCPQVWTHSLHAAAAWIAGAIVYVGLAFWLMAHDPTVMRKRAEQEDESRFVFSVIILLAVAASFGAVAQLIAEAKAAVDLDRIILLTAAGLTVALSWLVVQIVFTLHYAHDYYRPSDVGDGDGDAQGLLFPGGGEPDYWDFFYFSTSLGAAAQTSDVAITSRPLRRLATGHAVLSFAFNTTVLALAINMASSVL